MPTNVLAEEAGVVSAVRRAYRAYIGTRVMRILEMPAIDTALTHDAVL